MAATDHLNGLDPYALLDAEAARIEVLLAATADDDPAWNAPSHCEGWTMRDLVGHLAATEEYHHACLDDTVADLFARAAASGVTSLHDWNQHGVDERRALAPSEVAAAWRLGDEDTRRRMRERDGGEMGSSIGPYPVRLQAFHIALELATHADDLGIDPGADGDRRWGWRAQVSRFTFEEHEPDATATAVPGGTVIVAEDVAITLDDRTFVDAVAGRLVAGVLDPAVAAKLSTMP